MSIGTIIIIVLLTIIAACAVIALTSNKAGADYDRDLCKDFAKLRAELDAQSERAAKEANHG